MASSNFKSYCKWLNKNPNILNKNPNILNNLTVCGDTSLGNLNILSNGVIKMYNSFKFNDLCDNNVLTKSQINELVDHYISDFTNINTLIDLLFGNTYYNTVQYFYKNDLSSTIFSSKTITPWIKAENYFIEFIPRFQNSYAELQAKIFYKITTIESLISIKVSKFEIDQDLNSELKINDELVLHKDLGPDQMFTNFTNDYYLNFFDTKIEFGKKYKYQFYYKLSKTPDNNTTDISFGFGSFSVNDFTNTNHLLMRELNYQDVSINNNTHIMNNNLTNNYKLLDNNLIIKESFKNNFPTNFADITNDNFQDSSYNIKFKPHNISSNLLLKYNIYYKNALQANEPISFMIKRHIKNDNNELKDISEIIVLDTSLNSYQGNVVFTNIYSIFYLDQLSKLQHLNKDDYLEYKLYFKINITSSHQENFKEGLIENSGNIINIQELQSQNDIANYSSNIDGFFINNNIIKNYKFVTDLGKDISNTDSVLIEAKKYIIHYKLKDVSNSILLKYKINFECNFNSDESITFYVKRIETLNKDISDIISISKFGSEDFAGGPYRNIFNLEIIDNPKTIESFYYQIYYKLTNNTQNGDNRSYGIIDDYSSNFIFLKEFINTENNQDLPDINYLLNVKALKSDFIINNSLLTSNKSILQELSAGAIDISTTLNVSGKTNLQTLLAVDASFTNLDVSNNTKLQTLLAVDASFTNLDVSNNTKLQTLLAVDASFTNLDVSNNTKLQTLLAVDASFTNLDVSNNTKLQTLLAVDASFTNLDVSNNTKLQTLLAVDASFTNLDVSNNTKLQTLLAVDASFTNLDVSNNTKLQTLLAVDASFTNLDVSNNTKLQTLLAVDASFTNLDVSNNTKLQTLLAVDASFTNLDVSNNTKLQTLLAVDASFTNLDVSNNTKLQTLLAVDASFTNLDVSNNTKLQTLLAVDASFTNLDVSNNTKLQTLLAVDASFSSVDISKSLTLQDASLVFYMGDTSAITIVAPQDLSSSYTLKLPISQGASGQILSIDDSGQLIFTSSVQTDLEGYYDKNQLEASFVQLNNLDLSFQEFLIEGKDASFTNLDVTGNLYLLSPESTTAQTQVRLGAASNRPGVYSSQQLELFSDTSSSSCIIFGDSDVEKMRMNSTGEITLESDSGDLRFRNARIGNLYGTSCAAFSAANFFSDSSFAFLQQNYGTGDTLINSPTGTIRFKINNGFEKMLVDANGVGIGGPSLKNFPLNVSGTIIASNGFNGGWGGAAWFGTSHIGNIKPIYNLDNVYDIGTSAAQYRNIFAYNMCCSSDDRLKDNETDISSALETIMKLKPQTYDFKTSEEPDAKHVGLRSGFIAQDILQIPELAHAVNVPKNETEKVGKELDENGIIIDSDKEIKSYLSLDYNTVFTHAVKAIQELNEEVKNLKAKIEILEAK
jgi:hypothetical protein